MSENQKFGSDKVSLKLAMLLALRDGLRIVNNMGREKAGPFSSAFFYLFYF